MVIKASVARVDLGCCHTITWNGVKSNSTKTRGCSTRRPLATILTEFTCNCWWDRVKESRICDSIRITKYYAPCSAVVPNTNYCFGFFIDTRIDTLYIYYYVLPTFVSYFHLEIPLILILYTYIYIYILFFQVFSRKNLNDSFSRERE